MLKNLGVVQVFSRLPRFRANARRKFAGRSLLEWVIRRVTDAMRLDGVIVADCEPDEGCGRPPSGSQRRAGVSWRRARRPGPLHQVAGTISGRRRGASPRRQPLRRCGTDRSPGDDGRVASGLRLRRLLLARRPAGDPLAGERVYRMVPHERPAAANRPARDKPDREQVTRYLYSHPEQFHLRLMPAPTEIDREDVRLTVDIEEDWDHAERFTRRWGRKAGLAADRPSAGPPAGLAQPHGGVESRPRRTRS